MSFIIETQDLEQLSLHVANELAQKTGANEFVVQQELLKFYSLIKTHLGTRVSDAQTNIVEKYTNPLTYQLVGDARQLQNELYNSLSNF